MAVDTSPPNSETPRWTIGHISRDANGGARIGIVASVPGVSFLEVAWFVAREVVGGLIQRGANGETVPTRQQVEETQQRALLLEQSPAVRIFARGAQTVWVGDVALGAIGDALRHFGWTDVGPVPADVRKACQRAQDEAGFDAAYLIPLPAAAPPAPPDASA